MTAASSRFYVDQLYLGQFEVMDATNGLAVAICPYLFDSNGCQNEVTNEARARAEAIVIGLNETGFDWQPPSLHL
jgi:hypothetical protein